MPHLQPHRVSSLVRHAAQSSSDNAFIAEIDAGDPDSSEALASLRRLAQRVTGPHIYLRFIGD
jgi:hypothetical protein